MFYMPGGSSYLYIILLIMVITNLMSGGFDLFSILISLPGVLIAITFHEYAHALAAVKLGDETPKMQGRLSLNPLSHLDPIGIIMLIFAHIGWGKPVEINPRNFKGKVSMSAAEAIVSAAGPIMNFILAFVFSLILAALTRFAPMIWISANGVIGLILADIIMINIGLGVFNLIPLPPLDGSKILAHFLPINARRWFIEHQNIFYIAFIVIWLTPIASRITSPIIGGISNFILGIAFAIFGI
mgnify:CR=1 FL=1